MTATGPSIRGVCRILNQSSCGSGSICGIRNGKSLILSNAHVCSTDIGRIVKVEIQSTGDKVNARVIQAAYSSRTWTDWAVIETVEDYNKVEPVKLSKNRPSGSHYTRGYPRCVLFDGSDIRTVNLSSTDARWTWQPNAIGGQSGSGVWSDVDHLQYGLLTWSIGRDGAGQMTSEIYRQARDCTLAGAARVDGMIELDDYDLPDDRGDDDPNVTEGFYVQRDITELPIWAGDDDVIVIPPNAPGDTSAAMLQRVLIESLRKEVEAKQDALARLEGLKPTVESGKPDPTNPDAITFGL